MSRESERRVTRCEQLELCMQSHGPRVRRVDSGRARSYSQGTYNRAADMNAPRRRFRLFRQHWSIQAQGAG